MNLDKLRSLSLSSFCWDDNELSRMLKGSGDAIGFIEAWEKAKDSEGDDGSQLEPSAGQKKKRKCLFLTLHSHQKQLEFLPRRLKMPNQNALVKLMGRKWTKKLGNIFKV